jgi:hypothetical protein
MDSKVTVHPILAQRLKHLPNLSERERILVGALKEVLATPSFGSLRAADAVDTIKNVRSALAKMEGVS